MKQKLSLIMGKHSLALALIIPVLFLLIYMIVPILQMFFKSIYEDGHFTIEYVSRFFQTPLYWQILFNTIRLSFIISILCILLGYPVAYTMNQVSSVKRTIIMGCVQLPFWTSLLVRTYALIAILQNKGLVNTILIKAGILKEPVQLLYNSTGVIIGMTYIMLPYMIFSISSVMGQIDKNILVASTSLGAGRMRTFFKVYLPLSKPGIVSGFFIVFLNTMGYYIVPSLLGGQKNQMISQSIQNQLSGVLNWHFAATISIILVMVTIMILLISQNLVKSKYHA